MNLSDIHMLKIKDANYYCINSGISIKLLQNICLKKVEHCKDFIELNIRIDFWSCKFTAKLILNEKSGKLWIKKKYRNFESLYKNGEKSLVILKSKKRSCTNIKALFQ